MAVNAADDLAETTQFKANTMSDLTTPQVDAVKEVEREDRLSDKIHTNPFSGFFMSSFMLYGQKGVYIRLWYLM